MIPLLSVPVKVSPELDREGRGGWVTMLFPAPAMLCQQYPHPAMSSFKTLSYLSRHCHNFCPISMDNIPPTWLRACMLSHVWHFVTLLNSYVHGIFQTGILEQVVISYSRGASWPRDRTGVSCISCIGRWVLYHSTTWGVPQPDSVMLIHCALSNTSGFLFSRNYHVFYLPDSANLMLWWAKLITSAALWGRN